MKTKSNTSDVRDLLSVDTIIHMGAGWCTELNDYLNIKPRQLVLVEADLQLVEDLQSRIEDLEHAQVICSAVVGHPGPAILYRYNLPELNSLHQAIGLMALFPGLKLLEQQQVLGISPVALLEPLQLQAEKENQLVIDLPGEELPVLQALQQSEQLYLFNEVVLHCGREPLYEGSVPASRILEWLRDAGFDLIAKDDSRDPDRPCWNFHRNVLQLRNRELQQQVEQLLGEKRVQDQYAVGLKAQAQKLIEDHDAQIKVAKERQVQLDKVAKELDDQAKLVTNLNGQLEQVKQDKSESDKLAADRKSKLEAAVKTRDEQVKLVADLQGADTKVDTALRWSNQAGKRKTSAFR